MSTPGFFAARERQLQLASELQDVDAALAQARDQRALLRQEQGRVKVQMDEVRRDLDKVVYFFDRPVERTETARQGFRQAERQKVDLCVCVRI